MERFYKYVKIDEHDCWIWQGCLRGKTGYGAFKFNGKVHDTHRLSYFLSFGDIEKGKLVCHTCDNRRCVNPEHLFLGTYKENYEDAVAKGRIVKPQKRHPSMEAYKRGCRCKECEDLKTKGRIKQKKYMQKWRAEKK